MPPRRAHTKSRSGCFQCRQRKVKCDENGLPCGNCVKRELPCTYPAQRSLNHSPQDLSNGFTPSTSLDMSSHTPRPLEISNHTGGRELPSSGLTRLQELELMHHYTTVTCTTMASGDIDIDLWRIAVPQEAAQHESLMEALLALSALHLATLYPAKSRVYTAAAFHYQNLSLTRHHNELTKITDSNCRAIFACSMMVTSFTLAMANRTTGWAEASPLETLETIFELVRGNVMVVQASYETLKASAFSPIFTAYSHTSDSPAESDLVEAMKSLRDRIDENLSASAPDRRQILLSAVDLLEQEFNKVAGSRSLGPVLGWPVLIDPVIITLLKQEDPVAQLIFAHYGVLLLHVHNVWWGRDFGLLLIEQICDRLHTAGGSWWSWTQWPREKAMRVGNNTAET